MGTWGTGNFDNDGSRDYLRGEMERWIKQVDTLIGRRTAETDLSDLDGEAIPAIELMAATIERFGPELIPDGKKIAQWSKQALKVFDAEMAEMEAFDESYPAERRRVIAETFDRLREVIKRHEAKRGEPDPGP